MAVTSRFASKGFPFHDMVPPFCIKKGLFTKKKDMENVGITWKNKPIEKINSYH